MSHVHLIDEGDVTDDEALETLAESLRLNPDAITPAEPSGEPSAEPAPVNEERDTPPVAPESDAVATPWPTSTFPAGREREACSAAVYAARDYIRDHGPATMREIVTEVMPEHPLGYDVDGTLEKVKAGDRYRVVWLRSVVNPGFKPLEDIRKPPEGRSEWRYTDNAESALSDDIPWAERCFSRPVNFVTSTRVP